MANLSTIVSIVAADTGLTKIQTEEILRSFIVAVRNTVAQDGEVNLPGLGSFRTKDVEARTGRNPKTGEAIDIAATKRLGFKPAKAFKDTVKESV